MSFTYLSTGITFVTEYNSNITTRIFIYNCSLQTGALLNMNCSYVSQIFDDFSFILQTPPKINGVQYSDRI